MPIAIPHVESNKPIQLVPEVRITDSLPLDIRMATVDDVHGMSALINQYASANVMLARGPQYLYQHIQDYMVITAPSLEDDSEIVVACGALHVLWSDLAEIRSIAVHRSCQGMGLGKKLVEALIERCRVLRIPRVFVFTLVEDFFAGCAFEKFSREELPPVVWVECSKCPKFYRCDEVCMMRILAPSAVQESALPKTS